MQLAVIVYERDVCLYVGVYVFVGIGGRVCAFARDGLYERDVCLCVGVCMCFLRIGGCVCVRKFLDS